jgi:hypothetical protein
MRVLLLLALSAIVAINAATTDNWAAGPNWSTPANTVLTGTDYHCQLQNIFFSNGISVEGVSEHI